MKYYVNLETRNSYPHWLWYEKEFECETCEDVEKQVNEFLKSNNEIMLQLEICTKDGE